MLVASLNSHYTVAVVPSAWSLREMLQFVISKVSQGPLENQLTFPSEARANSH